MSSEDLFGQAFVDFYEGRKYALKIERDDGYVDPQDISLYFQDFSDFPAIERKALAHARGKVLDIGVGVGRAALYLQDKGLDVVGIDISDKAIEICRRRGVRRLVKMSACDLKFRRNSFDTALAFCNNFGLCGDMEGVRGMLEQLRKIVKKDGLFLAESIQPTRTNKKVHLRYHKMNIARGRPPGQATLRMVYRGRKSDWWDLLMVRPSDMRELCDDTGWRIERTYRGVHSYVYVLRKD